MKNEIINRLVAVCGALDRVTVCGKMNLTNMSGSMAMLEEVIGMLNDIEMVQKHECKKDELSHDVEQDSEDE